jgi:CMP-N-acetylneuraminic acid synthetase
MKVLAVISARGGSKEVPRKNVREFGGMPLVAHMFKKAKACQLIDRVICSTDDDEIAQIALDCGVEAPCRRPDELAGDRAPLVLVTQHAMQTMDAQGYRADIVAQLAPTCPFITVESITRSVELAMMDDCECAVSLKRIEHEHPYRARRLMEDGSFVNFIQDINVEAKRYHSRQDLPELYCTSGGIYTRKRHLLDKFDGTDFAMGEMRKGILMDEIEAVNIDRMIDFYFAQFLISEGFASEYISR